MYGVSRFVGPLARLAVVGSAAIALVLVVGADAASAQAGRAGAIPPKAEAAAPPSAKVTGFRSAHFGMTEDQVREAIRKDFKVKPEDIRKEEHAAERTTVLSVRVPDLLENGGPAELSYVLGHTSKRLIQVGALWSRSLDPDITPERLNVNARLLGSYFQGFGLRPDSITMNAATHGGILVFRGSDDDGRMVLLVLYGAPRQDGDPREIEASALALYYTADPLKPDVYRLPAGQF